MSRESVSEKDVGEFGLAVAGPRSLGVELGFVKEDASGGSEIVALGREVDDADVGARLLGG